MSITTGQRPCAWGPDDRRPRTGGELPAVPAAVLPRTPPVAPRVRADCTADAAGGLTFDLRLPAHDDAALLLRRRGGDPDRPAGIDGALTAVDAVRLPAAPAGPDGLLRAVLPSIMTLPEGRWDVHLSVGGGEPRRLLPGVHDLRSLVGRTPRVGRSGIGVRIPYATRYGNLTVRSWLRPQHAEAGDLHVEDGGMTVHGRLFGAAPATGACLEIRARRAGVLPVCAPAVFTSAADGPSGVPFTARLPYAPLKEAPLWDLWLRPAPQADPVRIARILDDVPDKKRIFTYPARRLTGDSAAPDTFARPYYTLDNDLSLRVGPAPDGEG